MTGLNTQLRLKWMHLGMSRDQVRRMGLDPYVYPNKFKQSPRNVRWVMGVDVGCDGTKFTAGQSINVMLSGPTPFFPGALIASATVVKMGSSDSAHIALGDGLSRGDVFLELLNWLSLNELTAQFLTLVDNGDFSGQWENALSDEFGFNICGASAQAFGDIFYGSAIGADKFTYELIQEGMNYTPGFIFAGPLIKKTVVPVTYYPPLDGAAMVLFPEVAGVDGQKPKAKKADKRKAAAQIEDEETSAEESAPTPARAAAGIVARAKAARAAPKAPAARGRPAQPATPAPKPRGQQAQANTNPAPAAKVNKPKGA